MQKKENIQKSASETTNNASISLFNKKNYQLIIAGIVILSFGYLLMIGGKSQDPTIFNEKIIYGFQRITLAPIVIVIGFGIVFYGILKNTNSK